ncbi:MAG TPA: YbaB/EbfC family nucleoid-associated protein [Pseudonocardiaceae bacterium]|jgi:DNA-binding protein YbaB
MITGWEPATVLFATLAQHLDEYTGRIKAEELTISSDGITVSMSVTGSLTDVRFEPRLRGRLPAAEVADLVLAAIKRAELVAAQRRTDIAEELESTWRSR